MEDVIRVQVYDDNYLEFGEPMEYCRIDREELARLRAVEEAAKTLADTISNVYELRAALAAYRAALGEKGKQ